MQEQQQVLASCSVGYNALTATFTGTGLRGGMEWLTTHHKWPTQHLAGYVIK